MHLFDALNVPGITCSNSLQNSEFDRKDFSFLLLKYAPYLTTYWSNILKYTLNMHWKHQTTASLAVFLWNNLLMRDFIVTLPRQIMSSAFSVLWTMVQITWYEYKIMKWYLEKTWLRRDCSLHIKIYIFSRLKTILPARMHSIWNYSCKIYENYDASNYACVLDTEFNKGFWPVDLLICSISDVNGRYCK